MYEINHLKEGAVLPSWKEHKEYCRQKGVDEHACEFANQLIDEPEKNLPSLLQNEHLRKHLYQIFGFEWVFWISTEMKNYWKTLTHGELHGTSKKISYDDIWKFRKLIEEIAAYLYGEHGRQAVQLHFELDEADHVLKEIRQALLRSIEGSLYDPSERKWLPASSLVNRVLSSKNAEYVLKTLIETGPRNDPLKNYRTFLVNMRKLLQQKSKASASLGKTFEELINENPQLKWLSPIIKEAKTSELNSGYAVYECPNCKRKITILEGNYHCKNCGPNYLMKKISDIKIKDLDSKNVSPEADD